MDVGALGGAFADEREPFDINVGCGIGIDPVQVFFSSLGLVFFLTCCWRCCS